MMPLRVIFCLFALLAAAGCGKPATRVEDGNRRQILHKGNASEPQDLDPHIVTGVPEHFLISAFFEGLAGQDPVDLHPVPGAAASWNISSNGLVYTFHLQPEGRWSNGEKVTASDFVESYKRILAPSLASEYSYMLHPMKNAEAYNSGSLTNFNEVGVKALNDLTLEITLHSPTPYFLSLIQHYSWYPVHIPTIARHGPVYQRGNRWTRAGHLVGNGPFNLTEWKFNYVIVAAKSPTYWDSKTVKLNEIRFYAIDSQDTEERAFRAGQLHLIYQLGVAKIDAYKKNNPQALRIDPYLGTYFYQFNVTKPPFDNPKVRRALAMAIDRESLVRNVTRGGEMAGYTFVPPGTAGYQSTTKVPIDIPGAQKLLAEAGYPNGQGFPEVEILYNTLERHKIIAEAVQQMWKQNLNIDVKLVNEEWKVFLDSQKRLSYQVSRFGWIGDYVDPNSFLDMWLTGGGNNRTGWSNAEYDRLVKEAGRTGEQEKRFALLQQAEDILLSEGPIAPIYIYTQPFLIAPSVRGWNPTLLDQHPYKHVYLEESRP